jgi:CheY-like chemotaxis protein
MHNRFNPIEELDGSPGTRVFSKQQELKPHRLNLNRLIVQATHAFEHVLGPGIALQIACDQDLPPVQGVANMIKVALMDLCAAARAAIGAGGRVTLLATVKTVEERRAGRFLDKKKAEFVCLSVRFNQQIPDADSPTPLASVYAVAQQHCGWLELTRDESNDTSFDLYLPVAQIIDGTTFVGDRVVEICGGHETILLVEDELDLLSLTRDILERYGYRVITAPNGMAAVKTWIERRDEIDLLLTDIRMPEGISGHELAERLLCDKATLKVVYISGYSVESTAPMLEFQSIFVTKPFTPAGLAQTIRHALDFQKPDYAAR